MEKSNSLEGPIFERESRIALRGSPTLKGQEMEKCFQRGSEPNKDFWLVLNKLRTFGTFIKSEKLILNPLQL